MLFPKRVNDILSIQKGWIQASRFALEWLENSHRNIDVALVSEHAQQQALERVYTYHHDMSAWWHSV